MSAPDTSFSARAIDEVVLPCPLAPSPAPQHWIEFELVGEDGKPIPWEEFTVALPNGDTARGYLDEKGFARIASIPTPGKCGITFPRLDITAWEPCA